MTKSTHLIENLTNILPNTTILTDHASLKSYGVDWTRIFEPNPIAIALPKTTDDVVSLVKFANDSGVALVPSGGRTGLSGAAVAKNGELVVAFDRMNQIKNINLVDQTLTCEAGVITQHIQETAETNGLYYPVDFASAGSSQIGGNIATNAGGIKVIRYGMTRNWVSGLKVVTGKGEILDLNQGLTKNATGYDLRQLFIGSEGTLGFIVEATMKLTRLPKNLTVLMLGVNKLANLMHILQTFQANIDLTAYEFLSEKALKHVLAHSDLTRPFETNCDYYALLEFEQINPDVLNTAMENFEHCLEKNWIVDGVISQNETQAKNLWALRERISESIAPHTPYKNDIAVTIANVPDFLTTIDKLINSQYPDFEVIWFGHIGDGNLHLNILKPENLDKTDFFEKCSTVSEKVFATVQKFHGSISAEHGVGLTKKPYLTYSRTEADINYMRAIKQAFDPNNIMNPGKIFD